MKKKPTLINWLRVKDSRCTGVFIADCLGINRRTLYRRITTIGGDAWLESQLEALLEKQLVAIKDIRAVKSVKSVESVKQGEKMSLQQALSAEQSINLFALFSEAIAKKGRDYVINSIDVHKNTVKRWEDNKNVPDAYTPDLHRILGRKYVLPKSAQDKDQYFTKPEVAEKCLERLHDVMADYGISRVGYTFVEPSTGQGSFLKLLPKNRRIGIDIEPVGPLKDRIIKSDYLQWQPPTDGKYIVVGNPPFGLRGNLALNFIHHSSFADIVAFILPPLFASNGKGVAGTRVKGFKLAYSQELSANSFSYPDGKDVDVATVFQVWIRDGVAKVETPEIKTCDSYIKIYSVSDGGTPGSTRNKRMHAKCHAYLPSTVFKGMKLYRNFESLPHRRGYGVVFLKERAPLIKLFESTDWEDVAFRSTNGALNLRSELIQRLVTTNGMWDK